MSAKNTVEFHLAESLRAALSAAKSQVERLEAALVIAEENEATAAVLAMVETVETVDVVEEPIPAEPVPEFVPRYGYGPVRSDGTDVYELSSGSFVVSIHAYASEWQGLVWSVCSCVLSGGMPAEANGCEHVKDWADAVRQARRLFAKWSVPAAVVAIAA